MAMAFKHGEHYKYTYRDYLRISTDGKRWELIDGVPYMMAAPSREHQRAAGKIFRRISNFLDGRRCEAFMSPFDVRLPVYDEEKTEDITNVVQPDISVYCNQLGTDEKGGRIAPDIVIGVSP
jgi:Uma2 family endonuclease